MGLLSIVSGAAGGVTSFFSQYLLYITGTVVVLLLIATGTQTIRLNMAHKDLATAKSQIETKDALLATNSATLNKLKIDGEKLQDAVLKSQDDIIKIEQRHSKTIQDILKNIPSPTSGNCEDMVTWAKKIALRK